MLSKKERKKSKRVVLQELGPRGILSVMSSDYYKVKYLRFIIKLSHVRVRKTANDFAVMRVTDVIPASKAASSADLPHNTCMHS